MFTEGFTGGADNDLYIGVVGEAYVGDRVSALFFDFANMTPSTINQLNAMNDDTTSPMLSITINGQTIAWDNVLHLVPVVQIAGCPDGAAGNDVLVCTSAGDNYDYLASEFSGRLGNDIMTAEAGAKIWGVTGDGDYGENTPSVGQGGNDIITNYAGEQTNAVYLVGDNTVGHGGDDILANYAPGYGAIMGDYLLAHCSQVKQVREKSSLNL